MPRSGLDSETVVTAAAALADANGLEAVTLTRLAHTLGVRAPSLYVHVDGLPDLRGRLAARGARELATAVQGAAAGRATRLRLDLLRVRSELMLTRRKHVTSMPCSVTQR